MSAGVLRLGSKDGVAASDVGDQWMGTAAGITKRDDVLFTGPATVPVGSAVRQETAEDAVLRMEDGKVLIGDRLEAVSTNLAGELGDLFGVEVVRGCEPGEAGIEQDAGGEGIGGVEAEVAGERGCGFSLERIEPAGGADKELAIELEEEFADLFFAGLEDAGCGNAERDTGGADLLDRRPEAIKIEIVEREAGGGEVEGGVELLGVADEEVELRVGQIVRQRGLERWGNPMAGESGDGVGNGAGGGGAEDGGEIVGGFTTELVQEGTGDERIAFDVGTECGEREGRIAEPGELLFKERERQALTASDGERLGREDFNRVALGRPTERQRRAGTGNDSDFDGNATDRGGRLEVGFGGLGNVDVVGAPEKVAGVDAGEIDGAIGEGDFGTAALAKDLIEVAAFLLFGGAAPIGGIEDNPIAGLERGDALYLIEFDDDPIGQHFLDAADEDTAMARGATLDDTLMVDAGEEEVPEAP